MGVSVIVTSDAAKLFTYFGDVSIKAAPVAQESFVLAGGRLLGDIKERVSVPGDGEPSLPGEPPAKQTGDYQASWEMSEFHGPGEVGVVVGTDAAQARRLEWGFVGMDSLGRHFNQAPRPHVGPAVDQILPLLGDDILDVLL